MTDWFLFQENIRLGIIHGGTILDFYFRVKKRACNPLEIGFNDSRVKSDEWEKGSSSWLVP